MPTIDLTEYASRSWSHHQALVVADAEGWTINTYNDPSAQGREGCSIAYAEEVARHSPGLVYLSRESLIVTAPQALSAALAVRGVETRAAQAAVLKEQPTHWTRYLAGRSPKGSKIQRWIERVVAAGYPVRFDWSAAEGMRLRRRR